MLQSLREHIQGWIAGIIIFILAAAFLLWGVSSYVQETRGGRAEVAKVNGQKLTMAELNQYYGELLRREQQRAGGATLSPSVEKELRKLALQILVTNTALLQAANDAGFDMSMAQVKQMIQMAPQFRVDGRFSPQRFQQYLYASGLTQNQFFERIKAGFITRQITNGIIGSAFVLPQEVADNFRLVRQTRTFGYFLLSPQRFADRIQLMPKQIAKFYKQNQALFKTPEKIQASYILLSPKDIKSQVTVSPSEITEYYQSNKANFTIPKKWQVSRILVTVPANANASQVKAAQLQAQSLVNKLKQGESFESLTKQKVANQKVMTQWVTADQLTGALAGVIGGLKIKQTSPVFRTTQGFNVVKILAIKPASVKPLSSVSDNIKKSLLLQKVQQIITEKSGQLSNLTYTNPNTLKVAAKAINAPVQTSPLLTRQGTKTGIFSHKNVLDVLFSNTVYEEGNNSKPLELKDGSVMVVRVSKKIPSKLQTLETVTPQIRKLLTKQIAERDAGLLAYKIQTALNQGKAASDLASQYKLVWRQEKSVARTDTTVSKDLMHAVFSLPVYKLPKIKPVTSVLLGNGNYAIIQLTGVSNEPFAKADDKEKKGFARNLQNFNGQLEYRLYAKGVGSSAKVEYAKKDRS